MYKYTHRFSFIKENIQNFKSILLFGIYLSSFVHKNLSFHILLIFHLFKNCADSAIPISTKSSNAWRHSSLTEAAGEFLNFLSFHEDAAALFDYDREDNDV